MEDFFRWIDCWAENIKMKEMVCIQLLCWAICENCSRSDSLKGNSLHFSVSKISIQTLSQSTTNLEEISPQNKILPLVAVPNAPFEQLFRITVYLPLGQLYVARIGAKTKLSDLQYTICMDKSLDSNKFEFKHPSKYSVNKLIYYFLRIISMYQRKLMPVPSSFPWIYWWL